MISMIAWYGRTLVAPDLGFAILGHIGLIGGLYLLLHSVFLQPIDWLIAALLLFSGTFALRGNIHKERADRLEAERIRERPASERTS